MLVKSLLFTLLILQLAPLHEACRHGVWKRKKRQTHIIDHHANIRSYFPGCIWRKLGELNSNYDWQANVDFTIIESDWYRDTDNSICATEDDNNNPDCWQEELEQYLNSDTDLQQVVKECICTYFKNYRKESMPPNYEEDLNCSVSEGRRKRSTQTWTISDQADPDLISKEYSNCIRDSSSGMSIDYQKLLASIERHTVFRKCNENLLSRPPPYYRKFFALTRPDTKLSDVIKNCNEEHFPSDRCKAQTVSKEIIADPVKGKYNRGEVVTFKCISPYQELVGSSTSTCQGADGWSSQVPTCLGTGISHCENARQNLIDGIFDPRGDLSCIDPCDECGTVIVGEANCSNALFCGWDSTSNTCELKTEKEPQQQINQQDVSFLTAQLPTGAPPTTTAETTTVGFARPFPIGGTGQLSPFVQPQYNVFPYNCRINPHDPHLYQLLNPPVNIPYCQRILCSRSDPSLEVNRYGCVSRPGCAYDTQLANIRRTKGHAILPGVPVCHLAIRNEQFHRLVRDYLKTSGAQWNGLHTRCFLAQHGAAILKAPCGCEVIASLQYFGIHPKIAGWPGITKAECHLINGCFQKGHCFFPVTSGKIQIKSAKDTHRSYKPTGKDIYGQPQCLPFDIKAKPTDYLSNYHNCYLSGCAMDPSIGYEEIKRHLCQIALSDTVPNHLKQKFWKRVQQVGIRADNWREELNKLRYDTCPPVYQPILPSYLNPFSLTVGRSSGGNSTARSTTSNVFTNYLPGCTPIPVFNQNFPGFNPTFPRPTPFSLPVSPQANSFFYPNPNPVPFPNPNPFPFPFPGFPTTPVCPYKQFSIHGYQPLTGSFAGCCRRHYCYIPRSSLDSQYSGVASYWSEWTTWSECSVSCRNGHRTRSRECVGKDECDGEKLQKQVCNDGDCPSWTQWGSYGKCSVTCGGGKRSRTRSCSPSGSGCPGSTTYEIDCNTGACPTLSDWSPWSHCPTTCGQASQTRKRRCIDDGAYGCHTVPKEDLGESQPCQIYCGSPVEVSRTSCTPYPDCKITIAYECIYQGQPGHCHAFQSSKTERCYSGYCQWLG